MTNDEFIKTFFIWSFGSFQSLSLVFIWLCGHFFGHLVLLFNFNIMFGAYFGSQLHEIKKKYSYHFQKNCFSLTGADLIKLGAQRKA